MEAQAITRHIRQSPRKIKVILDEIRGAKFEEALNYLHFSKAKAASAASRIPFANLASPLASV